MPVLFRYLFATCLRYTLGLYFGFALLQIGQQVIAILEKLPNIALGQLATLVVLLIPDSFNDVAPLALALAILLTGNQLYSYSEMFVLRASGLSPLRIYFPLLCVATSIGLMMVVNASYYKPEVTLKLSKLVFEITNSNFTNYLIPGEFREIESLGLTVTAKDNRGGQLQDVFIHQKEDDHVITGQRAYIVNQGEFNYTLTIEQGSLVRLSATGLSQIDFDSYNAHLSRESFKPRTSNAYYNSLELSRLTSNSSQTELHWRLSRVLYCLCLAGIALLFIPKNPRSGTSLAILGGVVMYFFFNDIANSYYWKANKGAVSPQWVFWLLYPSLYALVLIARKALLAGKERILRAR